METVEFYQRVAARLPADFEADPRALTHQVLVAVAARLTPAEAADLGAELPRELGDLLLAAKGDGELSRDQLIEDLASRLDLDDDEAEAAASAVLMTVREAIEPVVSIEQVLETLPPDLAQLMQST